MVQQETNEVLQMHQAKLLASRRRFKTGSQCILIEYDDGAVQDRIDNGATSVSGAPLQNVAAAIQAVSDIFGANDGDDELLSHTIWAFRSIMDMNTCLKQLVVVLPWVRPLNPRQGARPEHIGVMVRICKLGPKAVEGINVGYF